MRWALLWSTSLLAACVVAPLDPLPSAVRAAEDGDLLRALAYLDQVPAMHPRHAAAQALAQALQARIAASQRWLAEGARLQAAGDALAADLAMRHAREAWPRAVFVEDWSASLVAPAALAATPTDPPIVVQAAPVRPADVLPDAPEPPNVLIEPLAASQAIVAPYREATPLDDPSVTIATPPAPMMEASPGRAISKTELATLRASVRGRDKTLAIARLSQAHASCPENLEIRSLLADLLHQRALVAYGRGWLETALEDWERITSLLPDDRDALERLDVAREELKRRRSWAERRKNAGG